MKHAILKAASLLLVFAAGTASADLNLGVGVKAGTLGLGLEGRWAPLPYLDVRVGVNSYDFDDSSSYAGIDYDATLNLESYYATGNFRFPLSPFRVTAGIYSNGNEMRMVSVDSALVDVGQETYTSAEVGTLQSVTAFSSSAPYLGVGYDFSVFGKVGLNLDFGVLWQGDPEVSLLSDGLLASDPAFMQELEDERLELEDDMSDFKAWPVISLGFVYNF